ncbi:MAG: type II toxin-antitoxin system RelE/ParE family toxin [Sulfuricurvum sp.]|uniref:type II toxin-antitoxin system RelE/ParE family toxin n=1 Tax=Sulfuricurvum sp. TaxID=2025608 RepID=UPI0025D6A818|nr:type II toxin-antitoxin system RelE/ParE family toxin [Sulfuricurvum sp.]MCK9374115.1 type II toxin-antitoxin system RelE/ParE family toxin [Sulfuricurvum sp.]
MRIRRSGRFENELGEVIDYIAKDKKSAAKAFNRSLQSAIETLTDHPNKGRPNDDGYRELVHKGYTVPYLIDGDNIVILGIFNQNQWSNE